MAGEWAPDILGAPYVCETIDLPDDDEGAVVATLVHRPADADAGGGRTAVLHVHGFNDYFFHTDYARWWGRRGCDFYALDLRKYGRSIREHQTPCYTEDLGDYYPEIDEAWRRITERDGHDRVVLSAHSTGGLTLPLWAHDRRTDATRPELVGLPQLVGMVLNSPWVDMHGPFWVRTLGARVVHQVGARQPRREIPRTITGFYGRSLHRDHEGEWDFDLAWKPVGSWPLYAGWLRAVRLGHARVHRGLDVGCPVLVLSSARTSNPPEMNDDVHSSDIVLDVTQIRRWAPMLAPVVTVVSVTDAMHDVLLSREEARARVYAELDRWCAAYAGLSREPTAAGTD